MKRPNEIAREESGMNTIVDLTATFEGLASMRIAQIKNQVLQAQSFFEALWAMYTQMRVDPVFRFGRGSDASDLVDRDLLIAITAEGGFSGDIDQKLLQELQKKYKPEQHDIIMIGHHGVVQLAQAGIPVKKSFKLPSKEQNITVAPLVAEVRRYRNTTVFYQTYVSLMVQDVRQIELSTAVQNAAPKKGAGKHSPSSDIISEETYIFEPSTFEVVAHLERSMLDITLSQLILDSKLAQYASRFRAMSMANTLAEKNLRQLHLNYNRSRRSLADERLKEILNAQKAATS